MPTPRKNSYTYADYLTWNNDERWEIIAGVPYMQSAPSRLHQEILMELARQFSNYLLDKPCKIYPAPFCVRLDIDDDDKKIKNVVEPDLTIVCDESKLDEKGCKGSPDMIIEIISPSTAKMDKVIKFNKYEEAGVKEYWIIEPEQKLVSVFLLQDNMKYGRPEMYTDEDNIIVSLFPDLEIHLKSVFS